MRTMKTFVRLFVVTCLVGPLSSARAVGAPDAGTKTLIDYFLPTPIVCPLTSNTWGAAGVLPRDICNGLEDSTNKQYQYWDGKVFKGPDGKYHMYAGQWPQNKGFADWPSSVIAEGVSNGTVVGSYTLSTTTPFTGKEQNVTGAVGSDGSYVLLDSLGNGGTGNIYTSTSLADPWTSKGQFQISGGSTSTQTTENLTIWANADGSFEIMSRSFQEMVSPSNILGPYTIKATVPSFKARVMKIQLYGAAVANTIWSAICTMLGRRTISHRWTASTTGKTWDWRTIRQAISCAIPTAPSTTGTRWSGRAW